MDPADWNKQQQQQKQQQNQQPEQPIISKGCDIIEINLVELVCLKYNI